MPKDIKRVKYKTQFQVSSYNIVKERLIVGAIVSLVVFVAIFSLVQAFNPGRVILSIFYR